MQRWRLWGGVCKMVAQNNKQIQHVALNFNTNYLLFIFTDFFLTSSEPSPILHATTNARNCKYGISCISRVHNIYRQYTLTDILPCASLGNRSHIYFICMLHVLNNISNFNWDEYHTINLLRTFSSYYGSFICCFLVIRAGGLWMGTYRRVFTRLFLVGTYYPFLWVSVERGTDKPLLHTYVRTFNPWEPLLRWKFWDLLARPSFSTWSG